jgi:hypothetical protein
MTYLKRTLFKTTIHYSFAQLNKQVIGNLILSEEYLMIVWIIINNIGKKSACSISYIIHCMTASRVRTKQDIR